MLLLLLLLVPAVGALTAYFLQHDTARRVLLVLAALTHAALTLATWVVTAAPLWVGWVALDPLGQLFLSVTTTLFLAVAVYTAGYLDREGRGTRKDFEEGLLFANAPEATFTAGLLLFLAAMTLVTLSQRFGILWVAIELTTLTSAPLIYFHRHHRSLEATWKYLLICSVGIALALLGNFFLAVAASPAGSLPIPLTVPDLLEHAPELDVPWLKAAFLLLLVGYGTKMGLAPLHTWLPDAHSEAPSAVSALLSGALLNCAFLGILRVQQICVAAGQGGFGQQLLVGFGLFSMGVAAVFLVGQPDYKRLLAYSSIEHMGVMALGIGIGGLATFGAILHAVNHSMAKAMLFLTAGNILAAYQSKSTTEVRGVLHVLPASGLLWVAGFLAITGSPPFGLFLSEFTVLRGALDAGRSVIAIAYLLLLATAFVAMASTMLGMAQGSAPDAKVAPVAGEPTSAIAPPAVLAALVLILGLYVPSIVRDAIWEAARTLH